MGQFTQGWLELARRICCECQRFLHGGIEGGEQDAVLCFDRLYAVSRC